MTTGIEPTLTTEKEVPRTDEELAAKIRGMLKGLCEVMDQMSYRDWTISHRIYSDDMGRWHAQCTFTKTVSL